MRHIAILILLTLIMCNPVYADEKLKLEQLLAEFLSGQTEQHHEQFWAEELVYTSSAGTRFGKAEIMAGFKAQPDAEATPTKVSYSGTDVEVRLYGDTAIVAFMLVAKEEGVVTQTYFNTGTFHNKSGKWQAVAWQATKIPKD